MATVYQTPGVYLEEIPKFPPSIAAVETAIPAFIGYTEKAARNGDSLHLKPTRIESIAEYEELFGYGPAQSVELILDSNNGFVSGQAATALYLYDSLRLFYANGGGKCYIVSVGAYPNNNAGISASDIEKGLTELAKEDEPTIILLCDAVSIEMSGPYAVQQQALSQCKRLMDRIVLCDLTRATDLNGFNTSVQNFRDNIGINALKYGTAYGPWIHANLPRQLLRRSLVLKRQGTGTIIELDSLSNDNGIKDLIRDIKLAETTNNDLSTAEETISAPASDLDAALKNALDGYQLTDANSTAAELNAELQKLSGLCFAILKAINDLKKASHPAGTQFKIQDTITSYLASSNLSITVQTLAAHHKKAGGLSMNDLVLVVASSDLDASAELAGFTDGTDLLGDMNLPNVDADYVGASEDKEIADVAANAAYVAATAAITLFHTITNAGLEFENKLNDALLTAFGKYKELVGKAAQALNLLPPSGAVAGIYASVDRERGVWKAPANVSLNAVIGPAVKISHEQQAEYNVDSNAGKSINIIRSFTGKGTLVWGARTLAGNDNEWRYINVRRFFNFVEESVKKATEQFVFEPNDANTWVKIQAMIENFLTTLWRQGALQGVKPEHAFYVAVGLGKTMTPLDILEGRLIVEIGMAAVRPAEFIILKFSHKMAES